MNRMLRWFALGLFVLLVSMGEGAGGANTLIGAGFNSVRLGDFPQNGSGIGLDVPEGGDPVVANTFDGEITVHVSGCPEACSIQEQHTHDLPDPDYFDFPAPTWTFLELDDQGVAAMATVIKDDIFATPDKLGVVRCTDDSCTDVTTQIVANVPILVSLDITMVGPNHALPLVFFTGKSMVTETSTMLRVANCHVPDCSTFTTRDLAPVYFQANVSAAVDPLTGRARVVFTDPGLELVTAECQDVPCTALTNQIMIREGVPPYIYTGYYPSLAHNHSNNTWAVVYEELNNSAIGGIRVAFSTTNDFTGTITDQELYGTTDGLAGARTAVDANGNLYIQVGGGFGSALGQGLHLIKCAPATCVDPESVKVHSDFTFWHNLTIADDTIFSAFEAFEEPEGLGLFLATAPTNAVFPETIDLKVCVETPGEGPLEGARVTIYTITDPPNPEVIMDQETGADGCAEREVPEAYVGQTVNYDLSPPSALRFSYWHSGWVVLDVADPAQPDLLIEAQATRPQPPEVKITRASIVDGVPVLGALRPIEVEVVDHGCAGGFEVYDITDPANPVLLVELEEEPPGTHRGTAPAYGPGNVGTVSIQLDCADQPEAGQDYTFDAFVDPTGYVRTTGGAPLHNAEMRLFRSLDPDGPFPPVLDDSTIMGPGNRDIPDNTDRSGRFGWSTVAGWYKVRAQLTGCHAPGTPGTAFVESPVLVSPGGGPVDPILVLECPGGTSPVDTNCDDAFTVADPLLSLQVLAGTAEDPGCQLDADGSGAHELADVLLQVRMIAGLSPSGPQ